MLDMRGWRQLPSPPASQDSPEKSQNEAHRTGNEDAKQRALVRLWPDHYGADKTGQETDHADEKGEADYGFVSPPAILDGTVAHDHPDHDYGNKGKERCKQQGKENFHVVGSFIVLTADLQLPP